MIKTRVIQETTHKRTIFWTNPLCGHEQEFEHSMPAICSTEGCRKANPALQKLHGDYNQDYRVKYHVDGKW